MTTCEVMCSKKSRSNGKCWLTESGGVMIKNMLFVSFL